jgi:hypothetical protein
MANLEHHVFKRYRNSEILQKNSTLCKKSDKEEERKRYRRRISGL